MPEIKLRSYVGEDGILHLHIPVEITDALLEVTITFKPDKETIKTPEELGWSPKFFEKTAGAWKGEPLVREEQRRLSYKREAIVIYLLDTNTCIQYINQRSSSVVRMLKAKRRSDVAICDVVKSELYYGAYKIIHSLTVKPEAKQ